VVARYTGWGTGLPPPILRVHCRHGNCFLACLHLRTGCSRPLPLAAVFHYAEVPSAFSFVECITPGGSTFDIPSGMAFPVFGSSSFIPLFPSSPPQASLPFLFFSRVHFRKFPNQRFLHFFSLTPSRTDFSFPDLRFLDPSTFFYRASSPEGVTIQCPFWILPIFPPRVRATRIKPLFLLLPRRCFFSLSHILLVLFVLFCPFFGNWVPRMSRLHLP